MGIMLPHPKVTIHEKKVLHKGWSTLTEFTYDYEVGDKKETIVREAYDRGNGVAALLYHPEKKTVILTKQFRLVTYINQNHHGMLIEACAGQLDGESEHPEIGIKREIIEETGYQINEIKKIFSAYMSPGTVTELLHFYLASYDEKMKVNDGGGVIEEREIIEVLELPFDQAYSMIEKGEIIDGKTIMLLQYCKINQII